MYSIVEVTIKRGEQILLDLLKDNPTRAVMQDNFSAFLLLAIWWIYHTFQPKQYYFESI